MIIIDGYNVIYKWKTLKKYIHDIDHAREKLINMLANYQGYKEEEVVLVLDSAASKETKKHEESPGGLQIIYASNTKGADIFIEELVGKNSHPDRIKVVTGDYLERLAVASKGAQTISPERFEQEVIDVLGKKWFS